jgi:hypothetical protein
MSYEYCRRRKKDFLDLQQGYNSLNNWKKRSKL